LQFLEAVKAKNKDVKIVELSVTSITETGAEVTVKIGSKVYAQGLVKVSYTVEKDLKNISVDVKVTELGKIIIAGANPTAQEILAKVSELNPAVDINQLEIKEGNESLTATEATISVKESSSDYVKGDTLKVTYIVARQSDGSQS